MDLSMPDMNGLEATRQIHNPATDVIILTMHDSETLVRQVFASGARGYLLKPTPVRSWRQRSMPCDGTNRI